MIAANASMKQYRPRTPGGQPLPNIPKAGDEKYYDIRYFPNDHRRRDVGYYPDTPLSLTHNIMKNTPLSKTTGCGPTTTRRRGSQTRARSPRSRAA